MNFEKIVRMKMWKKLFFFVVGIFCSVIFFVIWLFVKVDIVNAKNIFKLYDYGDFLDCEVVGVIFSGYKQVF